MNSVKSLVTATAVMAGMCSSMTGTAFAKGHSNPVDLVSNPDALDFSDVEISHRDFRAPFIRDGVLVEPQRFATIAPNMTQSEVKSLLGEPHHVGGSEVREWDYNFKFKMPQSINYIVCQYKVTFDEQRLVNDATWRRRQCQRLASAKLAEGE
jgi:outer membrane protein assembly factor BamE (lipoprotein component of BamABCDE complex)